MLRRSFKIRLRTSAYTSSFLLLPTRGYIGTKKTTSDELPSNVGKARNIASPTSYSRLTSSTSFLGGTLSRKSASFTSPSPRRGAKSSAFKDTTPKKSPALPASEKKGKSLEDQLSEIEQLMDMAYRHPTADLWGQAVATLDVQIPHAISLNPFKWVTQWSRIRSNFLNNMKSAASMYRLASANAFPDVHLPHSFIRKTFLWPIRIFQCRSTKSDAWIAGIRKKAFDTYKAINKAISTQNEKAVKRLTISAYQDSMMKILRKRKGSNVYVWCLHNADSLGEGDNTVARVLSIRVIDGYVAKDPPKIGTRLLVQALVKFNTEQSLQVYTKMGELQSSVQKQVVEYLVLEKRMWYDGPWMIREQIFETDANA